MKRVAIKSEDSIQWNKYHELRYQVTNVNRLYKKKKRSHHQNKIYKLKLDGNKLWKTFNNILDQKYCSFIESDGVFITKPLEVANYFNDFLIYFIADHIAELVCLFLTIDWRHGELPKSFQYLRTVGTPSVGWTADLLVLFVVVNKLMERLAISYLELFLCQWSWFWDSASIARWLLYTCWCCLAWL